MSPGFASGGSSLSIVLQKYILGGHKRLKLEEGGCRFQRSFPPSIDVAPEMFWGLKNYRLFDKNHACNFFNNKILSKKMVLGKLESLM